MVTPLYFLVLLDLDSFASRLPAEYSLLFRLFQLPMCNRWAISRIVKIVSRLNHPAIASFSRRAFGISLRTGFENRLLPFQPLQLLGDNSLALGLRALVTQPPRVVL